MKDLKALKDLIDVLKNGETERKVRNSDKKVIVSIDNNVTDDCGCVGVELCNIDRGAELAFASAALLATCLESTVKGKEEQTLLLIILLATKVFTKSPEEAIANQEEILETVEKMFGSDKEQDKED